MFPKRTSKKMIVICGPTGIGKTKAAITLAGAFYGEIVGADSMQVYRRMDIGTAKPTPAEQTAIRHHMIDVVEPTDDFDAACYMRMSRKVVDELLSKGRVPFVAGGTGLYIKALLYGLVDMPPGDAAIRNRLNERAKKQGLSALYTELDEKDPDTAGRLHENDRARIVRALEVLIVTGHSISSFQQGHRFSEAPYTALKIGLRMNREKLYEQINRRVNTMMATGLEEEVRKLLESGLDPAIKSMQSLGYRHMTDMISGKTGREETVRMLKRDHRRYAKRQMTWFRADPEIRWFQPGEVLKMKTCIRTFLQNDQ